MKVGHVEFGETFEKTAVRETKEETGLALTAGTVKHVTTVNCCRTDELYHYVVAFVVGR
jgi:ADP-ribose pyrophosphatase YjhB (NUDIX family)